MANIEKSCTALRKSRHGTLGGKTREVFMFHAFKHVNHVKNDFKNISMEIVKACGGLPLSLEILGYYLCDIRDLEIWKNTLCELKGGRNIIGGSNNEMFWKAL